MKIIPSPLLLKIVVILFALLGVIAVAWNINYIFQQGLLSPSHEEVLGLKNTIVDHAITAGLYVVMAVYLFKLVGGTSNREIISRKNLMSVNGILYVLCAQVLSRIVFASFIVLGPIGRSQGIAFQLVTLIYSSWPLMMMMVAVYVLATVFKWAVMLKEEEALTI